jgi:CheY-like chemotaxis protein
MKRCCRVFVVDDEPDLCEILKAYLELDGFEVETAANGEDALRRMTANADGYKALVTDLFMPHLDGLEMIARVKASHPDLKVVAISGRSMRANYLGVAHEIGADVVLQKPFAPQELSEILQRWCPEAQQDKAA